MKLLPLGNWQRLHVSAETTKSRSASELDRDMAIRLEKRDGCVYSSCTGIEKTFVSGINDK